MKGSAQVIIVGIVALLIGAGITAAFFLLKPEKSVPSPSPSPATEAISQSSPSPDPTADWKTYTSDSNNYSLQHPETAEIITEHSQIQEDFTYETTTIKFNSGELKIWDAAGGRGVAPIKSEKITIAGVTTDKFYESDTEIVFRNITAPSGKDIYFSYRLPADNTAEIDKLFDQILSTFEFIE